MKHFESGADFRLVCLIDPANKMRPDNAGYAVPIDKLSAFIQGVDKLAKSLGAISLDSMPFDEFLQLAEQAYEYRTNQSKEFKVVR